MLSFIYGIITGVCCSQLFNLKQVICDVYTTLYHTSSLRKVSSTLYSLQYEHCGKSYRILLPIKRGPKKILSVTDENDKDVTDAVRVFLGPNEDFHQHLHPITPKELGFQQLTVHDRSGLIFIFGPDDTIVL